jgi:hypothetical protein
MGAGKDLGSDFGAETCSSKAQNTVEGALCDTRSFRPMSFAYSVCAHFFHEAYHKLAYGRPVISALFETGHSIALHIHDRLLRSARISTLIFRISPT